MSLLPLLFALLTLLGAAPARADGDAPSPDGSEPAAAAPPASDFENVDDPRALYAMGDRARDDGELDRARTIYAQALEKSELHNYLGYRDGLQEALILERLGDVEGAAAKYREGFVDDVQTTMQVLRIASVHPDREALFQEAVADVKDRVARAKAGEQVPIYMTTKGAPRFLEVIPSDQVVRRLQQDGGELRYCYIDELVLTEEALARVPESIFLSRCVVGRILIPNRDLDKLILRSIVLGDVDVGKTWSGEVNKSKTIPGSRINEVAFRDSIFLGRVNMQDVKVFGRSALFAMAVFEGEADFRDTVFHGTADFRFSTFGQGANYKGAHMTDAVYFGNTRYSKSVTFRGMFSEHDVFFNSAEFMADANFDRCEWVRGATFENSTFHGPVSFNNSSLGGRLNMSRTVLHDTITVKEMQLSGMDFIGAHLHGDAAFVDVRFDGKVRFSLDDITRAQHLGDPTPLLSLYRDYQGDADAELPLTTKNSYGVDDVDDLIAHIDGNLSFANSVFADFCVFERVVFGLPGQATTAEFYNTQFKGESHFERTVWNSKADFTTIFANELSFNEAEFRDALILDDANVFGRITLTDAEFGDASTLSMYATEIRSLEIDRDHAVRDSAMDWIWQAGEDQRLFYQICAFKEIDHDDPRIVRMVRGREMSDDDIREACADRLIDEYVALKESFGDRAMTGDEDWAYWWIKHTQLAMERDFGGPSGKVWYAITWPLFEIAFGWGVNLGNLAWTCLFVCLVFAWIYRVFCPESVMAYDGDDVKVKDISFAGLFYISLQSFGAFNTGWDFGEDDGRLRYINTVQTFIGVIVLTFFVGAYTRMILA
ncbi:MAG: hypothetical protein H6742_04665 [Alphaproteobacteria bacterium]|nr:hypothetical protein [Alphaproteobacteria bacterium]